MSLATLLLVEDDFLTRAALADLLMAHHYGVDLATDGAMAIAMTQATAYDLILLDLQIPKLDGIGVCQHLRSHHYVNPILLLTARTSNADIVAGLDAGADDYVTKPYEPEALLARIRALLRRQVALSAGAPSAGAMVRWGDLCLDLDAGRVTLGDQAIALTATEFNLLELFLRNPDRIFSRDVILDRLWGLDNAPTERAIVTHVKDVRKKLKAGGLSEDIIETVYGMGYRLKPPPVDPSTAPGESPLEQLSSSKPASGKFSERSSEQSSEQSPERS
ncbi:MAG TPA: response regulator transcription factor, partial [Chroococcidiopsis sp.]